MRATAARSGHGAVKVAAVAVVPQAPERRAQDAHSRALGWPRLLSEPLAAAYLGMSTDLLAEYVKAGLIHPLRLPRPETERMRNRQYIGDGIRRRLFDRRQLDAFVDGLEVAPEAR